MVRAGQAGNRVGLIVRVVGNERELLDFDPAAPVVQCIVRCKNMQPSVAFFVYIYI